MPNKILIPLQSLVSCFLKPPVNRRAAGGTIEGLWRGYSSACPKGAICWAPLAVTQAGGVLLSFLFSVPKIRPMKLWAPVRYLANFLGGYERDSLARFSHCFSLLSFSPLPGLEPGQNPGGPASGPNKAQALRSHCKNSVTVKAIDRR